MFIWTGSALFRWSSQSGSVTRVKASHAHAKRVSEVVRQTSLMLASATPEQATLVVGYLDEVDVRKLATCTQLLHCEVRERLPAVAEKVDREGDDALTKSGKADAAKPKMTAAERLKAAREKSKRLHA